MFISMANVEAHGVGTEIAPQAAIIHFILGDPEVTSNIYCKSRNLPNTDTQNYSTDLR